ncbi:gfo/Idh/MocA family oxidoreductase [Oceanobacillus zhaokaii]|uniref:Gfo/Idh/MocA family oxidoreductase n=1 Tax=Oceanobacillus zhaokaii TaxID=2052660 RepID=A0A345PKC0_9BACI|nr:Gfo/Idh/MocA family oxidoreductase [Oceanobacillus zhaokaii]AXI10450.1 gfo/Idh/MocA family oxidoreductase [Oceanobacillus zhaokaii]
MQKIKVGFVGVGGVASIHLKNIAANEHATIAAVCDIVEESAFRAGEKYGAAYYTDADLMFKEEKLDAVFICVPPFAHGDIEEKAAQLGIHLMVEKPIGLEMATVERKLNVIRDAGVLCATGYCLRYIDTVKIAKEYLKDKKIAMIRGHYLTSFVSTPWYREKKKSGGQLVEQATHIVDFIRYLAGDIAKVHANMNLLVSDGIPNIDIPDVTSVNFLMESGAVGHLDASFIQIDHRMGVELLGDKFRLSFDGADLTIVEEGGIITYRSKEDFYKEQDNAFIEAVRTNNKDLILSDYENGLETLRVTLLANESQEKDEVIRLREVKFV